MSNQTLFADAQIAKCNILNIDSEILEKESYGIDCGISKSLKERCSLGAYVWLAESGCLDSDEECDIKKKINKNILTSLCGEDLTSSCDQFISCPVDGILVEDDLSCLIPPNELIIIE